MRKSKEKIKNWKENRLLEQLLNSVPVAHKKDIKATVDKMRVEHLNRKERTKGYPRGMSGYRARRQMADSRGPVLVAGLSLN
jgi:hypothetical protein